MNTSGSMLEEYNYDPCLSVRSKAKEGGRRRNPTNWSYTGVSLPTYTNRGFTGHEHLDMFELIHMSSEAKSREQSEAGNGREYDPEIARFLSPDPVIQDPYSIFSYNRYSYCLNNPLKYVDPSGLVIKRPEEFEWQDFGWIYSLMDRVTPSGDGGGGGGGSSWVNSYLDYVHACFENGYESSTSEFNYEVNKQTGSPGYNGSVTIQTGIIDYYTFTSIDGGKTWNQGNYINSKPIYSTISVASGGSGVDFSLARMYLHFQVGGREPMIINASSIDFTGTSQKQLGLTGMKVGDQRSVNLFKSGINSNSLAFGKVEMIYRGNNQFSVLPNMFDFNIEWQNGFSARNVGTVLGAVGNYNIIPTVISRTPIPTLVPILFGGPYNVIFNGTTTIPR